MINWWGSISLITGCGRGSGGGQCFLVLSDVNDEYTFDYTGEFGSLPGLANGKGISRDYYNSGKLKYEENYKDGTLHGIKKKWFENGNLEYEKNYTDGSIRGIQKKWFENGKLEYEGEFKDGVKNGFGNYYFVSGGREYEG